jgi:hypothetical protein
LGEGAEVIVGTQMTRKTFGGQTVGGVHAILPYLLEKTYGHLTKSV